MEYGPHAIQGVALAAPHRRESSHRPSRLITNPLPHAYLYSPTSVRSRSPPLRRLAPRPSSNYHVSFFLPLFFVLNILWWPWIILGYVWRLGGVPASTSIVTWATTQPRSVTYVSTLFGTLFSALAALFFSTAIIRFSQKWFGQREEVDMFHVSFFMTLRYQFFPWGWQDWSALKNRWYLFIVVAVCILAFGFIPSGISALLAPTPFQRTALLMGTELDFASSDPACLSWIRDHSPIRDRCMTFVSQLREALDINLTKFIATDPQQLQLHFLPGREPTARCSRFGS